MGRNSHTKIYEIINSVCREEEFLEEWKKSFILPRIQKDYERFSSC